MRYLLFSLTTDDPSSVIAMLLGGFVLVYLAVLRPMLRRKKDPLSREQPLNMSRGALARQRDIERDMQNLLVEYERMIRNMTAGVDTRAARLEALMREADQKIAALRGELGAGNTASAHQQSESSAATIDRPPMRLVESEPDEPMNEPAQPEAPSGAVDGEDSRYSEIYALLDQGLSAKEVARRLGTTDGEILLIQSIRGGRKREAN
jgi:hypothetical protein